MKLEWHKPVVVEQDVGLEVTSAWLDLQTATAGSPLVFWGCHFFAIGRGETCSSASWDRLPAAAFRN